MYVAIILDGGRCAMHIHYEWLTFMICRDEITLLPSLYSRIFNEEGCYLASKNMFNKDSSKISCILLQTHAKYKLELIYKNVKLASKTLHGIF